MDKANPECPHCDSKLKCLFHTTYFCPNDLCYSNRGRPEYEKAYKKSEQERLYKETEAATISADWICPRCARYFGGSGYCTACYGGIILKPANQSKTYWNCKQCNITNSIARTYCVNCGSMVDA